MSTITEFPGAELEVQHRTASPVIVPIDTARGARHATDRAIWVVLAVCSLLFAAMLVARVFLPAVNTVTSSSNQDYQQAP